MSPSEPDLILFIVLAWLSISVTVIGSSNTFRDVGIDVIAQLGLTCLRIIGISYECLELLIRWFVKRVVIRIKLSSLMHSFPYHQIIRVLQHYLPSALSHITSICSATSLCTPGTPETLVQCFRHLCHTLINAFTHVGDSHSYNIVLSFLRLRKSVF